MVRRSELRRAALLVAGIAAATVFLLAPPFAGAAAPSRIVEPGVPAPATTADLHKSPADSTLALEWASVLLECVRRSRLGPPMVARAIAVTFTCGYDAWAMYDKHAIGTRLGGDLRRPKHERTPANRQKAYSYGAYRALLDLFPAQADFIRGAMSGLGYDPNDASTDPATPSGIGNVCSAAVTDFRHHDGSNQLGDLHAGPYTDYTGYVPVNDPDHINDPNRWQPLRFSDGAGGFVTPGYVAPQWGRVTPFALESSAQFRPGPPATYPSSAYERQAQDILDLNGNLTDKQKMIAEYWADGPRSELPPGHWQLFGGFVSLRDRHTFDEDVTMFFMLGNAVMDAGIAVWESKRFYDSERPITAIRFLNAGRMIEAYVPFHGRQMIHGEDWLPYQPLTFITPPFPEYCSGHSAFSSAGAEILERFTHSDRFGASVTLAAGSSKVEPGFAPAHDVKLGWKTFSDAADEAGISRRYGGIHFEQGDLVSRRLGRRVAEQVWEKAQVLIRGKHPHEDEDDGGGRTAADRRANSGVIGERELGLGPIGPNPARGPLRVTYSIAHAVPARLSVIDVQGREIATLAEGVLAAGRHEAVWNRAANTQPPGVYFVRLWTPERAFVRRVSIID